MYWAKTTAKRHENCLSFGFGVAYIRDLMVILESWTVISGITSITGPHRVKYSLTKGWFLCFFFPDIRDTQWMMCDMDSERIWLCIILYIFTGLYIMKHGCYVLSVCNVVKWYWWLWVISMHLFYQNENYQHAGKVIGKVQGCSKSIANAL